MDTLRWLFGLQPSRKQLEMVATDEVFPVHPLDDHPRMREIMLGWAMRFDDVLDADKLHEALARLLEIGDWRKLGGRHRQTPDGKLILCVPKEFTPERPAVRFSHEALQIPIANHPLASKLPKATEHPFIQDGIIGFTSLAARPDAPKTIEDLIYSDEPQIALNVFTFEDATLVGLSFPHTMTDIMGVSAIMNAWTLVLAGRESEVPPFKGAREHVLDEVDTTSPDGGEPFPLAAQELKGLRMARFGLNFMLDMHMGPKMHSRTMFVPHWFVSLLRKRAVEELAASHPDGAPFISDSDILTAWGIRVIAGSPRAQSRPITAMNIVDFRRFKDVFDPKSAYVQNLVSSIYSSLEAQEALDKSLGQLAYRVRTDIQEQMTEPQFKTWLRGAKAAGYQAPTTVYGKPNSMLVVFTNWTKAKLYDIVDFSPAVISSATAENEKVGRPGKITYHHAQAMVEKPANTMNFFNVIGKDLAGNYWFSASLSMDCWKQIEGEFEEALKEGPQ